MHPGEILPEEFLVPLGTSGHALALQVPAPRINDIVRARCAVSVDTARRLACCYGASAEFWLGLQTDYDMAVARDALAEVLTAIRPLQTGGRRTRQAA